MKKRIAALGLAIVFLLACLPIAQALEMQPRAAVSVSGGLKSASGGNYVLWGLVIGALERKQVTATLYRWENNDWNFRVSTTSSGTTPDVETSKTVSVPNGYDYKVVVVGTSPNSSTTMTYYYDFK